MLLDKPREANSSVSAAVTRNRVPVKPVIKETQMGCWDTFRISKLFLTKKQEPKYVLIGSKIGGFLTQNPLAFYKEQEDAEKELTEIYNAMQTGKSAYELKYYVKVKSKKFSMYIVE